MCDSSSRRVLPFLRRRPVLWLSPEIRISSHLTGSEPGKHSFVQHWQVCPRRGMRSVMRCMANPNSLARRVYPSAVLNSEPGKFSTFPGRHLAPLNEGSEAPSDDQLKEVTACTSLAQTLQASRQSIFHGKKGSPADEVRSMKTKTLPSLSCGAPTCTNVKPDLLVGLASGMEVVLPKRRGALASDVLRAHRFSNLCCESKQQSLP